MPKIIGELEIPFEQLLTAVDQLSDEQKSKLRERLYTSKKRFQVNNIRNKDQGARSKVEILDPSSKVKNLDPRSLLLEPI